MVGNLLATDFLGIVANSLPQIIGLIMYVAGYPIKINCTLLKLAKTPTLVSQLLFATLGVDRFIAIAYPYRHRKIMTDKSVVNVVGAVWGMAFTSTLVVVSGFGTSYQYVSGFARCHGFSGFPFEYLFKGLLMILSTALIIMINIYLYRKILKSDKKQRENIQLTGAESREATNYEVLKRHIKPTVSILLLGGLDGIFNFFVPFTYAVSFLAFSDSPITRLYIIEFPVYLMEWLQLFCHPLVYGIYMTAIRGKLLDFELYHRIFHRKSKVIVLIRQ